MMTTKTQCTERVYDDRAGRYPCTRNAVAIEEGKPWCKQHLPSEKAKRQAASEARWKAENEVSSARYHRRFLEASVLTDIPDEALIDKDTLYAWLGEHK